MLTVKVAGSIGGRLANGNNITDRGLKLALYKILHNLGDIGDLSRRVRRAGLGGLDNLVSGNPFFSARGS